MGLGGRESLPDSTVNGWSRFLGVSVRPWSGASPISLIVRGLIQLAVCGVIIIVGFRAMAGSGAASMPPELAVVRGMLIIVFAGIVVVSAIGALRLLVGVLDLVPRTTVTGVVLSQRERRFLDFLPPLAQRVMFERRESGLDKRRARTEVVLETDAGQRQWTVTRGDVLREMRVGATVRLTVTPFAGHVARAEVVS